MPETGGAHIATSFLKENLVDELWLIRSPKIFGEGGNFVRGKARRFIEIAKFRKSK